MVKVFATMLWKIKFMSPIGFEEFLIRTTTLDEHIRTYFVILDQQKKQCLTVT